MIRFEHLTLGYGSRTLLDDVSAAIPAGSLAALVGRHGPGKSTLLRALVGLGPRRRGTIRLDGCDLDGLTPRRL
ncbi:MAG: ABC transporter ATP-binding protein, partial [Alistipes sp.]|nr:ABC transporter ATP-binding protein [Alistipes sp.]